MTDEDFSNILGGALYIKTANIEVMSESSLDDEAQKERNQANNQNQNKNNLNVFSMMNGGASTTITSMGDTTEIALNPTNYEMNTYINYDKGAAN